ncbi:hypothetical protein BJV82DRAFT_519699 [Fennellomyces sp. T-0311]|nr:hypothetical protein BJV82DRAFT_519699 [Fennellomyces sp. T-0311]
MPSPQGRREQRQPQQPQQQAQPQQEQQTQQQPQSQALTTTTNASEKPPVFMAQPKSNLGSLSRRGSSVQQQVYRMDGGIHPVDLLTQRLNAWRFAIKDLTKLFTNIEEIEAKAAGRYSKSGKNIIVPFPDGQGQFIETGGIQEVWLAFRNYTVEQSVRHQDYVNYIDRSVLPSLRNIKHDIKMMQKTVGRDKNLRTNNLYNGRRKMDTLVSKLDRIIQADMQMPDSAYQHPDPLLVNCAVFQANKQLIDDENSLHENILNLQSEIHMFEQGLVESIRNITQQLQEFRMEKLESHSVFGHVTTTFNTVDCDTEWNEFVRRNAGNLISPNAAYKSDQDISYPNQNHDLVQPVKVGLLERRSGIMRNWTEGLYVLTPAGFLHSYKSTRQFDADPQSPEVSIFVPHTNINCSRNYDSMYQEHCFEIRGKNAQSLVGMEKSFTLRAQDPTDLQDWFNKLVQMSDRFRPVPLLQQQQQDQQQGRALPPTPSEQQPMANDTMSQQQQQPMNQQSMDMNQQQSMGMNQQQQQQQQQQMQPAPQEQQGQFGNQQQNYSNQAEASGRPMNPQVIQVPADRVQQQPSPQVIQVVPVEDPSHDPSDETHHHNKGKEPVPLPKSTEYDDDDDWDTVPQQQSEMARD